MNKKGFTLVELLAVIAILAILVIVALPNVIGTLNTAKSSTFTEEVQTLFRQAQSQFLAESVKNGGSEVTFYHEIKNGAAASAHTGGSISEKKLDLDGNEKEYYVNLDRNGKVTKITVIDKNFCYHKAAATGGEIKITDIKVDEVYQTDTGTTKGKLGTGCGTNPKKAEN